MNGPESFSQGVPMAEKSPQSKWKKEEIDKGEDILLYIKKEIDVSRVADKYAQASIAARALGLIERNETFKNLPSSVKSYLEYVWWLDSPEGQEDLSKDRMANNLAVMKAEWEDPKFYNARKHPDDEVAHH